MARVRALLLLAVLAAVTAAPADAAKPRATIQRDSAGIPHITASSWEGLGYGDGYAVAEDHFCTLANEFVTVRAQRSRFFGPEGQHVSELNDAVDTNLASDFHYQRLRDERVVEKLLAKKPPIGPRREVRLMVRGFAAGYNAYLRSKRLRDPACKGKPWARPITEMDVWRRIYQMILFASSGRFITNSVAAVPPPSASARRMTSIAPGALRRAIGDVEDPAGGSNAIALGSRGMREGRGMLLANSHVPWRGTEQLWEHHLRLPGRMNVWGASFVGLPLVNEGYNGSVAWTHTNDTSRRFTFFKLKLAPGNPTTYLVDGEPERMRKRTVAIRVRTPGGGLQSRKHTFYITRYGVVTNLPEAGFAWTQDEAYALRDANADNLRATNTWFALGRARNVPGVRRALVTTQGAPWVNTLATDRRGRTIFANIGPVPHVTQAKLDACLPDGFPRLAWEVARLPTLDGSRSACNWGRDRSAISRGTLGPGRLPVLRRRDFVANANDSHWVVNPKRKLEGFPPLLGRERVPLTVRGRAVQVRIRDRLAGTDGRGRRGFDLRTMKAITLDHKSHGAELVLEELARVCNLNPFVVLADATVVDVREACPILAAYDRRSTLKSRGGWLFSEWWRRTPGTAEEFYSDPFDPNRPITTPNRLNETNPAIARALGEAVRYMRAVQIPLNADYGDVQHFTVDGRRIPVPGCRTGCFNSLFTDVEGPTLGEARVGSSAILIVQLTRRGARGVSISTHGQSSDPTSPWYGDGTRRYVRERWSPMRYTRRQIAADPKLRTRRLR